jgi:two-component system cell cycle sensor histidine kinase/response regulator CckA
MSRLHVLILEDNATDAALIAYELTRAGFDPIWQRVERESQFLAALDPALDVILADFNVPGFDALRALKLLKARDLDVPFIVVSGSIGEETAVSMLKNGAADYLLKDRLARLGQSVQRAIDERRLQRAKGEAEGALRDAEERMRFALQASHVGIWEVDLKTGAAHWSETLEALYGIPSGSFEGTFSAFLERIHPDDRQQVVTAIAEATRERTDFNVLHRTAWRDGTIHWINSIGRTLSDENGTPARAAGIGLDLTERVLMEEQLREHAALVRLGEMAAVIAHEVRNPLAAVRGAVQVMGGRFDPGSKERAVVTEIIARIDALNDLVKSMLLFARPPEPRPASVNIVDLIKTTAAFVKEDPAFPNLRIDVIGSVPPLVADGELLRIVLSNLLINSAQAMAGDGAIRVVIQPAGTSCLITISDEGPGIPSSVRDKIFTPFFTTKARGTGLGLPIAKRFLEAHLGSLAVECPPGGGTTIRISLPMQSVAGSVA